MDLHAVLFGETVNDSTSFSAASIIVAILKHLGQCHPVVGHRFHPQYG